MGDSMPPATLGKEDPTLPACIVHTTTQRFSVAVPDLRDDEVPALTGDTEKLGNWDVAKAVRLRADPDAGEHFFVVDVLLPTAVPVQYKYIVLEVGTMKVRRWEAGLGSRYVVPGIANLARCKATAQSTTFRDRGPHLAVNGNLYPAPSSCTSTLASHNPWWEVDLGSSLPISRAVVWPRPKQPAMRLLFLLSDTPFPEDTRFSTPATSPKSVDTGYTAASSTTAPSAGAGSGAGAGAGSGAGAGATAGAFAGSGLAGLSAGDIGLAPKLPGASSTYGVIPATPHGFGPSPESTPMLSVPTAAGGGQNSKPPPRPPVPLLHQDSGSYATEPPAPGQPVKAPPPTLADSLYLQSCIDVAKTCFTWNPRPNSLTGSGGLTWRLDELPTAQRVSRSKRAKNQRARAGRAAAAGNGARSRASSAQEDFADGTDSVVEETDALPVRHAQAAPTAPRDEVASVCSCSDAETDDEEDATFAPIICSDHRHAPTSGRYLRVFAVGFGRLMLAEVQAHVVVSEVRKDGVCLSVGDLRPHECHVAGCGQGHGCCGRGEHRDKSTRPKLFSSHGARRVSDGVISHTCLSWTSTYEVLFKRISRSGLSDAVPSTALAMTVPLGSRRSSTQSLDVLAEVAGGESPDHVWTAHILHTVHDGQMGISCASIAAAKAIKDPEERIQAEQRPNMDEEWLSPLHAGVCRLLLGAKTGREAPIELMEPEPFELTVCVQNRSRPLSYPLNPELEELKLPEELVFPTSASELPASSRPRIQHFRNNISVVTIPIETLLNPCLQVCLVVSGDRTDLEDGPDHPCLESRREIGTVFLSPSQLSRALSTVHCPILAPDREVVGVLTACVSIILPFRHPSNHIGNVWRTHWKQRPTLNVGHRGIGRSFKQAAGTRKAAIKENTLVSFVTAGKMGCDMIEFDVMLTSDRVPVIWHDFFIEVGLTEELGQAEEPLTLGIHDLMFRTLGRIKTHHVRGGNKSSLLARLLRKHWGAILGQAIPHHIVSEMGAPPPDTRVSSDGAGVSFSAPASPVHGAQSSDSSGLQPPPLSLGALADGSADAPSGASGPDSASSGDSSSPLARVEVAGSGAYVTPPPSPARHLAATRLMAALYRIPTLEVLFEHVPQEVAFDIEIKYPISESERPLIRDSRFDLNRYLDTILKTVVTKGHGRRILFSCFNPEICVALRMKQAMYPVFFLSDAESNASKYNDIRCQSLKVAMDFIEESKLQGVVADSGALVKHPEIVEDGHRRGIIMFGWGETNNDHSLVAQQRKTGVDGIIADNIGDHTKNTGGLSQFAF